MTQRSTFLDNQVNNMFTIISLLQVLETIATCFVDFLQAAHNTNDGCRDERSLPIRRGQRRCSSGTCSDHNGARFPTINGEYFEGEFTPNCPVTLLEWLHRSMCTSYVGPELIVWRFACFDGDLDTEVVVQQFKFPQPTKCKGRRAATRRCGSFLFACWSSQAGGR